MKRLTLFGVLLTLGLLVSTPVFSYDVEIDGIYYDLTSDSTACVTGDVDTADVRIIPSSINDNGKVYAVTEIGDSAFYSRLWLRSVTIGNSVTTIGQRAFSGCERLRSVTIGNSVTTIGDWAFYSGSVI